MFLIGNWYPFYSLTSKWKILTQRKTKVLVSNVKRWHYSRLLQIHVRLQMKVLKISQEPPIGTIWKFPKCEVKDIAILLALSWDKCERNLLLQVIFCFELHYDSLCFNFQGCHICCQKVCSSWNRKTICCQSYQKECKLTMAICKKFLQFIFIFPIDTLVKLF